MPLSHLRGLRPVACLTSCFQLVSLGFSDPRPDEAEAVAASEEEAVAAWSEAPPPYQGRAKVEGFERPWGACMSVGLLHGRRGEIIGHGC